MDLGKRLRDALRTLAGKPYIDEEEVKTLIKEIQRVLISSDVNVKLVFELSKNIEKNSLDKEKRKELTLKEHVLKVVYDELTALMGESYTPRLDKHKILICGLYGSGKCVHKSTRIPLSNGEIKTIKSIYDTNNSGEIEIDDGYFIDCEKNGPEIYAFNPETLKIEKKKVSRLWKLKKDKKLIKVNLDNGNNHNIIVTPEHPFFILENGEVRQIRADELKEGMSIATASSLEFERKELVNLRDRIKKELSEDHKINEFEEFVSLKPKRKGSGGGVAREIRVPTLVSQELSEFLGYVFGDGYMYKNYVEVTNNDEEILQRLSELSEKLFGLKGKVKIDKRNAVKKIRFSSKSLVVYLNRVFGLTIGKKSDKIEIPSTVLQSPNEITKYFIRSYFDTDGYVEKDSRHIEFCSASEKFIGELQLLLLRFRICPNRSIKTVDGREYHRLFIKSQDVETFSEQISSVLKRKRERLERANGIALQQGPGKQYMINVGGLLKKNREAMGISIGELQEHVNSYGIYENSGNISKKALVKYLAALNNCRKNWIPVLDGVYLDQWPELKENYSSGWLNATVGRLSDQGFVEKYHNKFCITEEGKRKLFEVNYFDEINFEKLNKLANSEVCWIKVNKLEIVEKEEFVYDLTVEDLHTFIANGIVVHNTTSIGKLANYYKTKGMKVGVVGADCDRPAAKEQLEQLSKQAGVVYYTIKEEKNSAKIVQDAINRSKEDILIVDSAGRSGLDSELQKELKEMDEILKPDETYLVVSADIGQVAGKQAEGFREAVPITGVIVTKLEGSGKGGGALSAVAATGTKIAFIGVGEKLGDFQLYSAERFVGKLLGVPDLKGLMEKIEVLQKEEDLSKLQKEEFNLETFYEQLKAAKKMGPLGDILGMLGMSDLPKDKVHESEGKLKSYECMINSMTKAEKKDPSLIKKSMPRMERIAKGSGRSVQELREFLSQFEKMEKMVNKFQKDRGFKKKLEQMMKSGKLNLPPGMNPGM